MRKIGRDTALKNKVHPEPGPDLSKLEERWQEASEREDQTISRGQKQLKGGLKDAKCPTGLPPENVNFKIEKTRKIRRKKL